MTFLRSIAGAATSLDSGLLIQKMIPSGQEVIIGVIQDAPFRPLLIFGSRGVEVEGLQDVAFALAHLNKQASLSSSMSPAFFNLSTSQSSKAASLPIFLDALRYNVPMEKLHEHYFV